MICLPREVIADSWRVQNGSPPGAVVSLPNRSRSRTGRELKAKSRCLELRARAWSREMRGHGYHHHTMSSMAMGRSSGGMDVGMAALAAA